MQDKEEVYNRDLIDALKNALDLKTRQKACYLCGYLAWDWEMLSRTFSRKEATSVLMDYFGHWLEGRQDRYEEDCNNED